MTRWNAYWFRPGGRTSAAVLRIAIGLSILLTLVRLHDGYAADPEAAPHAEYHAIGILRLLPFEPGTVTFGIAWAVGWTATIAMILGVFGRIATAASFAATLVIASYEYSFKPTWSHDLNAPLLAQLAFLGAHGSDALSIDAWWRKRRGRETPEHAYTWSIQLVQLALAIIMASAAYTKLVSGGTSLSWVLSDNLRNHILVRFDFNDLPRTAIGDWVAAEPWRWKLTAALNILAQAAPLVACFLWKRPVLRALFGSVFAIETIAIDAVMGLPNHHWLPLVAVFVDWDRLAARFGAETSQASPIPSRGARRFLAAFVALDLVIAFWRWPKIDQKVSAYPLSSFPMFASIRASEPYDEHHRYEMPVRRGRFEVTTWPPAPLDAIAWVANRYGAGNLYEIRTCDRLRAELAWFSDEFRKAFPKLELRSARALLVAFVAPPYPEPARLDRVDIATMAELAGSELRCFIDRDPEGRVAYYHGGTYHDVDERAPREAELVTRVGERWFLLGTVK